MSNPLGGINTISTGNSGGPCRESSITIIERRIEEYSGKYSLYLWLAARLKDVPIQAEVEAQLWNMLTRDRPY